MVRLVHRTEGPSRPLGLSLMAEIADERKDRSAPQERGRDTYV